MKSVKLIGLEVSIFLGLLSLGLIIAGWFLFRELILGITLAYLFVMLIMWGTILFLAFSGNKTNGENK